jgi:hypothetical protein
MLYIHPKDIRIIRNLEYKKPLCVLLESKKSFYHLIFNGNNSYTYYERKYNTSDHCGRTRSISELELARKQIHYYTKQGANPISPPLLWQSAEQNLPQNLDQDSSENNIEHLVKTSGWCPFLNRGKYGVKSDGTYVRILTNPFMSGFFSETQAHVIGEVIVYKVAGVEHRITEITYGNVSNFKDAHCVFMEEDHLVHYSHKEKVFYGRANEGLPRNFDGIEE